MSWRDTRVHRTFSTGQVVSLLGSGLFATLAYGTLAATALGEDPGMGIIGLGVFVGGPAVLGWLIGDGLSLASSLEIARRAGTSATPIYVHAGVTSGLLLGSVVVGVLEADNGSAVVFPVLAIGTLVALATFPATAALVVADAKRATPLGAKGVLARRRVPPPSIAPFFGPEGEAGVALVGRF